jgi:hypothetical protein
MSIPHAISEPAPTRASNEVLKGLKSTEQEYCLGVLSFDIRSWITKKTQGQTGPVVIPGPYGGVKLTRCLALAARCEL